MPEFSDFTIHVDESGDHGLDSINPEYPLFVLAFCLTAKEDYRTAIVPEIVGFKHRWFGHEAVILHAHDIRKEKGDFAFLFDRVTRQSFLADLTDVMERLSYTLVVSAIDKLKLKNHYKAPDNPYSIAMRFCLERAYLFLREQDEADRLTHVLVESRGLKEDADLEPAFRRDQCLRLSLAVPGGVRGQETESGRSATGRPGLSSHRSAPTQAGADEPRL